MSWRGVLRRVLLSFVLGGHAIGGVGMSQEKIEELMYAMNQTRVEASISNEEGGDFRNNIT